MTIYTSTYNKAGYYDPYHTNQHLVAITTEFDKTAETAEKAETAENAKINEINPIGTVQLVTHHTGKFG